MCCMHVKKAWEAWKTWGKVWGKLNAMLYLHICLACLSMRNINVLAGVRWWWGCVCFLCVFWLR